MADYSNDFDEINKLAKEAIEKLESGKAKNPAKAAVPESKPGPKVEKRRGKRPSMKLEGPVEKSPDQAVMEEAKKLEPKKKEPSAKAASKPQTAKPEVSKKAVKLEPEAVPLEAPPGQVAKRLKEQPISAADPMDAARSRAKTGSLKGRVKDQLVDPMDMVRTKGMMADSMPERPPARPPAAKIGSEVLEEAAEQAPMPQIPKSGWGERIAGEGVEELAEAAPRAAKTLEQIVPTKSAMQRFGERSAKSLAEGTEKIGKRMIGAPLVAAGVLAGPVGFALNALMESLDAETANPPEHDKAAIAASQKEAEALRAIKDAKKMQNRTPQQTIEDDYAEMLRQNPDQ